MTVEFAVTDRDLAGASNDAAVSFGDELVVEGTVVARNGGETATLRAVEYDAADATLAVEVETADDSESGALVPQALVGVRYRLTVDPEGPVDRTVVEHGGAEPWTATHVRDE